MSQDQRSSEGAPSARVLIALLLPLFASLMSISSVMVALPAIEEGLGATSADLQWVLSGYALAFGVGLVPAGRAGDLWGRRRFFLIGTAVFAATSLAAAFSPNPLMLNAMRIAAGLGAAMLVPQIIGMIQRLFTGQARGRAYGLMSTVIGVAVAIGPLLAGVLIDAASADTGWRLVFLLNVPVTAAALVAAFLWLPKFRDAHPTKSTAAGAFRGIRKLDPLGAGLLSVAIVCVMLPVIQFANLIGAAVGVGGLVLLVLWYLWEKRLGERDAEAPMVNLKLFTLPSYTWNSAVIILYFAGMPGIWAVVAIYIQQGLGLSALTAGLVMLPSAAMVILLASQVGRRVERIGPQMLVLGSVAAFISMLVLAGAAFLQSTQWASIGWVALALGVNGLSQALIIPSAQTLSMQDVPESMAGAAGGVAQSAQRVVTAIGLAVVTAVYFMVLSGYDHQTALLVTSLVISGIMLTSVLAAVGAARRAAADRRLSRSATVTSGE
ncbi:MFS transporter [Nesterenkonia natronophila]|uniref:MFS transporter n=1 Tax=Nesterenkonia natronophila TaxID=2174932 RepID=A0A3A4FI71_9MICC|nr:MFS transporter [Nesterenkonia natronophila]RJN32015.1 MFS transporter [Nesterenkonia natronophila]